MVALTTTSALSTLDEDSESRRLEAWLVLMLPFARSSAASILEEELERKRLEV
jgi:hypothetical protein